MANDRISSRGVIEAAGGLVWRATANGREIALVHRQRYNDWTLPKGWREKGETFAEAAVREVLEETGCEVRLGPFAGCSCYLVEGVPKIVLFWSMELTRRHPFQKNVETDAVMWLPPGASLQKLSYKNERDLIIKLMEQEIGL